MTAGTPLLKLVNGNAAGPQSTLAHGLAFFAVILLVGILAGGQSAEAAPFVAAAAPEAVVPSQETVYFPWEHVDQSRMASEAVATF